MHKTGANYDKYTTLDFQEKLKVISNEYQPDTFNWLIYIIGALVLIIATILIYKTNREPKGKQK